MSRNSNHTAGGALEHHVHRQRNVSDGGVLVRLVLEHVQGLLLSHDNAPVRASLEVRKIGKVSLRLAFESLHTLESPDVPNFDHTVVTCGQNFWRPLAHFHPNKGTRVPRQGTYDLLDVRIPHEDVVVKSRRNEKPVVNGVVDVEHSLRVPGESLLELPSVQVPQANVTVHPATH